MSQVVPFRRDPLYTIDMVASSRAVPALSANNIVARYYLAMGVPFAIDVATSAVYVAINGQPLALPPMAAVSALFLVLGLGSAAWLLFRPVHRYIDGEIPYSAVERRLANLPRSCAALVALFDAPLMAFHMLSARAGITFGATFEIQAWTDTITSFVVETSFNVVLTYFIVSTYLDRLCEFLFETRGVNITTFRGTFRRKVGVAILFVSFAAMTLLAGDIASYSGNRLLREAAVDVSASVMGVIIIYYWISQALTRPITRLDDGMRHIAEGDLAVRLPVTSDDEIGRATSGFNLMAEGLTERQYLRDVFGKYVNERVASEILADQERHGRVADTLAEATLMFTDIEGFTALSEMLSPHEVARILNTYYATVVPVIQHRGGVVNNCIGDGLFASFNLPLPQEDHAAAAIQAALEVQRALATVAFPANMRIRTRIGINTGPVIGVTIGTADWLSYTLLGDAVNIASRVEQLNKHFHTSILVTENTIRAVGNRFAYTCLGETDVRGHRGNVIVYSIDPQA
ncbi:Adenylate cyclase, class 3 [Enhydrobacter aerosaccus]|uniref:Adenylate cyclase, class 3 n=1 Tax=Enhydrobacter aerosaccus TaxID=225324 RepID=A0A1T4RL21_9HYPH|nr:adenylate/guanylate cyclase domain-containing protein [Enhydrobacter aerosaccus]SKA16694.1 Adenylate cyclase, class 3 [Enhydrobacter aerosaccus]